MVDQIARTPAISPVDWPLLGASMFLLSAASIAAYAYLSSVLEGHGAPTFQSFPILLFVASLVVFGGALSRSFGKLWSMKPKGITPSR
jgi:hypothetical protein